MPMTLDEKAAAHSRDQRLLTLIQMLGKALSDEGHVWSNAERKAFDWAWHELESNMRALAA